MPWFLVLWCLMSFFEWRVLAIADREAGDLTDVMIHMRVKNSMQNGDPKSKP